MLKETIRQYLVALFITVILFASFFFYLQATENPPLKTLSLINRVLANTSITLLGLVLLLGPLSRLYSIFDRFINYRKELGILAFFTALFHVLLVMFPLARRGPFGFYLGRPLSAFPGLLGLLLMFFLFLLSFERIKKIFSSATWWKIQYTGVRIVFLAAIFHFSVLRYKSWLTLISSNEPPSLNNLVTIFCLYVIGVRLSELLKPSLARLVPPVLAIILVVATQQLLF